MSDDIDWQERAIHLQTKVDAQAQRIDQLRWELMNVRAVVSAALLNDMKKAAT